MMAATLANGGVHPVSGATAVRAEHVGPILSVMATCGVYDFTGEWNATLFHELGMAVVTAEPGVAPLNHCATAPELTLAMCASRPLVYPSSRKICNRFAVMEGHDDTQFTVRTLFDPENCSNVGMIERGCSAARNIATRRFESRPTGFQAFRSPAARSVSRPC